MITESIVEDEISGSDLGRNTGFLTCDDFLHSS